MPCKRKMAEDYTCEFHDFLAEGISGSKVLVCKYCRLTFHIVKGINHHLSLQYPGPLHSPIPT
ncbi:UNVERIFIED_CONTAM: hypothetical protein FKN15_066791 [Acipenser sinensis]